MLIKPRKHFFLDKIINNVLCYGPTRIVKPPDALAMHKFEHHQGSATYARAATYASNRHASQRHRDMHALKFSPNVLTSRTIGDISPNSTEQSANIR